MASLCFKPAGMGPYPPEKHVRLSLETRGHGMLDIPTHGQLMIETGNRRQPEYGRPSLEQDDLTAKLCFQARPRYGLSHKIVGYDRFVGEPAAQQLAEVYRALRLYVNFFQPSLKLVLKRREGSQVSRRYDRAQTPCQRLLAAGVLDEAARARLVAQAAALDPVQLLRQLQLLQEALWQHAVTLPSAPTVPFIPPSAASASPAEHGAAGSLPPRLSPPHPERSKRRPAPTPQRSPRPESGAGAADTPDTGPEHAPGEQNAEGRKERRRRCRDCGASFSVFPCARERTSAYCASCGDERRRVQARARMQALRARRRGGAG